MNIENSKKGETSSKNKSLKLQNRKKMYHEKRWQKRNWTKENRRKNEWIKRWPRNENVIKISKNKNACLVKCSGTVIDTNWLIIQLVDVRTKLSSLVCHDHWQKKMEAQFKKFVLPIALHPEDDDKPKKWIECW